MKYCLRCAREIGEGHQFCPYCGTPQRELRDLASEHTRNKKQNKLPIILGIAAAFIVILLAVAIAENLDSLQASPSQVAKINSVPDKSFSQPTISVSAGQILDDFENNEIRAGDLYNGKRVQMTGCAAAIDNSLGVLRIHINSCGGPFDLNTIQALFPDNAKSQLSRLNKGQRVTVVCSIQDGGDVMGVMAKNCVLK